MSYLPPEQLDAAGVQALLVAAGDYVGPSDDLRPRVLEAVRRQRTNGQRNWRLVVASGSALAAVTLLSVQASTLSGSLSDATPSQRVAEIVATSDATSKSTGEGLWALVDAFFKVRSEQADAFRPGSATTGVSPSGDSAEESSEGDAQMPAAHGSL
jgi:hypothetical protein